MHPQNSYQLASSFLLLAHKLSDAQNNNSLEISLDVCVIHKMFFFFCLFRHPVETGTEAGWLLLIVFREGWSGVRVYCLGLWQGLGPLSVMNSGLAEVPEVGARQLQLVQHALVVHCLGVAAMLQRIIPGALVHAVGILVELVQAGRLHLAEEVERARRDRLALVDALARVVLLDAAEHEFIVGLFTILS